MKKVLVLALIGFSGFGCNMMGSPPDTTMGCLSTGGCSDAGGVDMSGSDLKPSPDDLSPNGPTPCFQAPQITHGLVTTTGAGANHRGAVFSGYALRNPPKVAGATLVGNSFHAFNLVADGDHYELNLQTNAWAPRSSIAGVTGPVAVAEVQNVLYAFVPKMAGNRLMRYNMASDTWVDVMSFPLAETPKYPPTTASGGGTMYALSGPVGSPAKAMAYDVATMMWRMLPDRPQGMGDGAVVYNGALYVFGKDIETFSTDVTVLVNSAWVSKTPAGLANRGGAYTLRGDVVWQANGLTKYEVAGTGSDWLQAYNIAMDAWCFLRTSMSARSVPVIDYSPPNTLYHFTERGDVAGITLGTD